MNKLSQEWLELAKSDLRNADILFENRSYKDSIWYCHQALEKLLKAVIANRNKGVRKIHDLVKLLEEIKLPYQQSISKFLEDLNPYYILTRYPEAGFNFKLTYSKQTTQKMLKTTKEIFKWLRSELNHAK